MGPLLAVMCMGALLAVMCIYGRLAVVCMGGWQWFVWEPAHGSVTAPTVRSSLEPIRATGAGSERNNEYRRLKSWPPVESQFSIRKSHWF